MKKQLTQKRLKELLKYDPETGIFVWKSFRNTGKEKTANHKSHYGYIEIRIDNKLYKAHRLAFLFVDGYLPENEIDHIDRDRSNNRYENLRHVSHICNMRNCKISKNNKSGVVGVSWINKDKRWKSAITVNYKSIHIGQYIDLKDAVKARWEAEKKYNFPNCNSTSSAYNYLINKGVING